PSIPTIRPASIAMPGFGSCGLLNAAKPFSASSTANLSRRSGRSSQSENRCQRLAAICPPRPKPTSMIVGISSVCTTMSAPEDICCGACGFTQNLKVGLPPFPAQPGPQANRLHSFGTERHKLLPVCNRQELSAVSTVGEPSFLLPSTKTRRSPPDLL